MVTKTFLEVRLVDLEFQSCFQVMFKKNARLPLSPQFFVDCKPPTRMRYDQKIPRLTGPANAREFGANFQVMLQFWDEGETLI